MNRYTVADNLRLALALLDLTHADLAARLGTSQPYVTQALTDPAKLSPAAAARFAAALDLRLEALETPDLRGRLLEAAGFRPGPTPSPPATLDLTR